jgi:hypothetical protein
MILADWKPEPPPRTRPQLRVVAISTQAGRQIDASEAQREAMPSAAAIQACR